MKILLLLSLLTLGVNDIHAGAAIDSAVSSSALQPDTVNVSGTSVDCFSVSNATGPILTVSCATGRVYISTDSTELTQFGVNKGHLLLIRSTSTTTVPLAIRANATQTGNFIEFQAANGAALSQITSGGAFVFNGVGTILGGSTGPSATTLTLDSNGTTNIPLQIVGRNGVSVDLLRIGNNSTPTGQFALHVVANNGNVGFFDTTPDAALEVRSTPTISGTGYVLAVSSADNTDGKLFAILGNGNVGINDPSPDALLEILASTTTNSSPTGFILAISSQNDIVGNIFAVLGSGNVGIGTSIPVTPAGGTIVFNINATTPTINLTNDSNTDWELFVVDSNGSSQRGPNDFIITQDGTNRLIIQDATGNVAIGTMTPTAFLDVQGQQGVFPRTTAQLNALAPEKAGCFVYSSSLNMPCYSTGTGVGAWVRFSSTSTAITCR